MNKLPVEHTGAFGVRGQQPHHKGYLQFIVERKPAMKTQNDGATGTTKHSDKHALHVKMFNNSQEVKCFPPKSCVIINIKYLKPLTSKETYL